MKMVAEFLVVLRKFCLLAMKYAVMAPILMVHFALAHPLGLCLYVFCLTAFVGMSPSASLFQLFCATAYLFVTTSAVLLWVACNVSVSRQFLDSILPNGFVDKFMGE